MTATTAQAATAFGVTPATVAHWCRTGAVRATKTAGQWVIDTASLLARKTIAHQIREARQARARKAAMEIEIFRHRPTRAGKMRDPKDGRWSFRVDGRDYPRHYATRAEAEQAAADYTPPAPDPGAQAAERNFQAEQDTTSEAARVPATGWSKASRRMHGGRGRIHDHMESLTGLASHAKPGECHYCGLDDATCDCR